MGQEFVIRYQFNATDLFKAQRYSLRLKTATNSRIKIKRQRVGFFTDVSLRDTNSPKSDRKSEKSRSDAIVKATSSQDHCRCNVSHI